MPMPGSPLTSTACRSPESASFQATCRDSSSSLRPAKPSRAPACSSSGMGGRVSAATSIGDQSTSVAGTGSGNPLSSSSPTGRNAWPPCRASSRTTSAASTWPPSAAAQIRDASMTAAPKQSSSSHTTSPVLSPTRSASGSVIELLLCRWMACWIATAASTPSDAEPNVAITPSPRPFTSSPWCRVIA